MIPHNRVVATQEEADAVASVVMSGYWATGAATERLERALANACGRGHCVAAASGLSALRLALIATGVEPGDRVGVPAYSCVALANAVLSLDAVPVPLDIDPSTLNVAEHELRENAADLSCAILVDTFGVGAAFPELPIPLIEDCSHGFGVGKLGRQGRLSLTSLYATKFLGSGRGGAILMDDPSLAEQLRDLRDYNDKRASGLALNEMPDDLNSALASVRLNHLSETIACRARLAKRYQDAFAPLAKSGDLALPHESDERVWYRYVLHTSGARDWIDRLAALGVQAAVPISDWLDDRQRAACPNVDKAYRSLVSLPLYPSLTDDAQDDVIAAVIEAAERIQ